MPHWKGAAWNAEILQQFHTAPVGQSVSLQSLRELFAQAVGRDVVLGDGLGVEAALLAPTALNQQKFCFILKGDKVKAKTKFGTCVKTDLGIAKYHFELGAGKSSDIWL